MHGTGHPNSMLTRIQERESNPLYILPEVDNSDKKKTGFLIPCFDKEGYFL